MHIKKRVNLLISHAKAEYVKSLLDPYINIQNKCWLSLDTLFGSNGSVVVCNIENEYPDTMNTIPKYETADFLNNYFANICLSTRGED